MDGVFGGKAVGKTLKERRQMRNAQDDIGKFGP